MAYAALGDRKMTWKLLQMINPVNHGNNAETIKQYKVEPYVIAADVYGVKEHKGRGGWTWYTGSAGWMYQLILESFIGLKRNGNILTFMPCIPADWPSVKIRYRYEDTYYNIELMQSQQSQDGVHHVIDGKEERSDRIALQNDQVTHEVKIYLQSKQVPLLENNPR